MFHNYSTVFLNILQSDESVEGEESADKKYRVKEKIIALKSAVDGLIVHDISPDC